MSDSLWPHWLQHTRLPCHSLSPEVGSNSCPLSQWCHLTISCSVTTFSSCPQSFPASGSFPMSWLFASGGQSVEFSASASVLLINIQSWLPLGLTHLISLQSKGLSRVFSSTTVRKHQSLGSQPWLVQKKNNPLRPHSLCLCYISQLTKSFNMWLYFALCHNLRQHLLEDQADLRSLPPLGKWSSAKWISDKWIAQHSETSVFSFAKLRRGGSDTNIIGFLVRSWVWDPQETLRKCECLLP